VTRLWLLAALAPLLVAAGLLGLRSVVAVVLLYHVGLCLVVPALIARREGLGWREHARRLGLGGPDVAHALRLGTGLGLVCGVAPERVFRVRPEWFPDAAALRDVLAGWGAGPAAPGLVLACLGVVNGPAEELFWRGFLQPRLVHGMRSACALVLAFSSYHVLTIERLAPGPAGFSLMLGGVVIAAIAWTWLRRRTESVWPSLLSHAGATLGYLAVCWQVLR